MRGQIDIAESAVDGASMSISINGQTGTVALAENSQFTIDVSADSIPLPNGYILAQASLTIVGAGSGTVMISSTV